MPIADGYHLPTAAVSLHASTARSSFVAQVVQAGQTVFAVRATCDGGARPRTALTQFHRLRRALLTPKPPCLSSLSLSPLMTDRISVNMEEGRKRAATNNMHFPRPRKREKTQRKFARDTREAYLLTRAGFYEIVNEKTTPTRGHEKRARYFENFSQVALKKNKKNNPIFDRKLGSGYVILVNSRRTACWVYLDPRFRKLRRALELIWIYSGECLY